MSLKRGLGFKGLAMTHATAYEVFYDGELIGRVIRRWSAGSRWLAFDVDGHRVADGSTRRIASVLLRAKVKP